MENDYLKHHGIQGMKWGQRNGPPYPLKPGAHSAAEKRYGSFKSVGSAVKKKVKAATPVLTKGVAKASETVSKGVSKAGDTVNKGLGKASQVLNKGVGKGSEATKEWVEKKLDNDEISEKAAARAKAMADAGYSKSEINDTLGKTRYGGIKDMTPEELKNANSRAAQEAQYMKNNSQGMKNDRKASDMSTAELQAYNTRRQAEDQYKDFQKKDRQKALEERTKGLKNAKAIVDDVNTVNKALDKSISDYYSDKRKAQKAAMDLSKYSDDDLRRAVNRMNLEKQFRDLTPPEISRGERVAANILRATGTAFTTSSTVLDIALKVKELID